MGALVRAVVIVDGENLTQRYQAMIRDRTDLICKPDNIFVQDVYVWNSSVPKIFCIDVFRIKYFTSAVGDEAKIIDLKKEINNISYLDGQNFYRGCQIQPYVYKKPNKGQKNSLVDMHIAVEAMRMAYTDSVDVICILSGDGDFIELYQDLMKRGKQVCVAAFSSGLSPEVPFNSDKFILLDDYFFDIKKELLDTNVEISENIINQ